MKANGNAYENTIETRRTRGKRRRHAKGMHKDTYGGEKTKQREHYYPILETQPIMDDSFRFWTLVSIRDIIFLHFGPQFTIGHVKRQCPVLIGHVSNFRHQCPNLDNNVRIQILVSDFRQELSDFGHQCPISVTRAQFLSQVSDFGQ